MLRIPARGRHVTAEPLQVADHLLGHPLASFRRRLAAFTVDLVLFGLVVGAAFAAASLASIHREDPSLLPRLRAGAGAASTDSTLGVDLLALVARRAPGTLPADLERAILAGDGRAVADDARLRNLAVAAGSGRTELRRRRDGTLLKVGTDVLLGPASSFFSWGAVFVGWFTLATRLGRGRTPGKVLAGVRVVRLDGRPLGWWAAFGRAGGYSASAATALLGFLEMIWDPNRQTLHDRVAGTVVVRGRRPPVPEPADG